MRKLRLQLVVIMLSTLLPFGAARAESEIANRVRTLLEATPVPEGSELEIIVGDPDPRLSLGACKTYEPFVPPGARLWGRTSLGVRCTEGKALAAAIDGQTTQIAIGGKVLTGVARAGKVVEVR